MNPQINDVLLELCDQLRSLYGSRLVRVVLFGSQARGDAEPGSDIDVLVVLQGEVAAGTEILKIGPITSSLSLKFNVVLSCTFMPLDRYSAEQSPLLINVRHEGIPL
jgi:predicted nucleotidyltransferase